MLRLRAPLSIVVGPTSTIVGAFSPNVDYITRFAVPTVVGGLFGAVLWGLKGGLIGGGAGAVVGYVLNKVMP
jgi:hypothetical protein